MNEAVENLDKVGGLITSAHITEAECLAREWLEAHKKSATSGLLFLLQPQ